MRALVLTHVLWVDKVVYALRQADGDPAALAGPALQHGVKLSLGRSETHVVSGYIGLPCWLGAQDGFANFLVKLPVEPALGKGGMVLLQGPGSRLASLAARRAVLVDDLGWKVRILLNLARFFCQFNRALLDFLLSPFFVRGNRLVQIERTALEPRVGEVELVRERSVRIFPVVAR